MGMRQDELHKKFYDANKPLVYVYKRNEKIKTKQNNLWCKEKNILFETELTDEKQLFKNSWEEFNYQIDIIKMITKLYIQLVKLGS